MVDCGVGETEPEVVEAGDKDGLCMIYIYIYVNDVKHNKYLN